MPKKPGNLIKNVAIYLRKSRDESEGKENVLAKHEKLLVDICEQKGYHYTIYREIESAVSIARRSEMLRLLSDIEDDQYDGVVVVDYDRLTRGDLTDKAWLDKIFKEHNILIVTPEGIINPNDDSQEMLLDFKYMLSKGEYKQIIARFKRGKMTGAKLGKWVNGKPPYPYYYNRDKRQIFVDPEKEEIYLKMKSMFLEGYPCYEIAWELNRMGIESPRGEKWHENTVYRILTSEVHLGKVHYGKTSGSGHKNSTQPLKKKDRSEWFSSTGGHQILKTQLEHAQILSILERRKLNRNKVHRGKYVLSGLVYCGKCNHSMQFLTKPNGNVMIKKCQNADHYGNHCNNSGSDASFLFESLKIELEKETNKILSEQKFEKNSFAFEKKQLEVKKKELQKLENGLERINDLYIDGNIDKAKAKEKTEGQLEKIRLKKEEIFRLEEIVGHLDSKTSIDKLARIQKFKEAWDSAVLDPKELNVLAKKVVDRIVYTRAGDEIEIQVFFL